MKIRIDIKIPQRAPIPTDGGKTQGQPQGPFAPKAQGPFMPGNISKAPAKAEPNTKIDRNDPCPCGSGKKYKNCCGKDA